jgi:hypothetical protein
MTFIFADFGWLLFVNKLSVLMRFVFGPSLFSFIGESSDLSPPAIELPAKLVSKPLLILTVCRDFVFRLILPTLPAVANRLAFACLLSVGLLGNEDRLNMVLFPLFADIILLSYLWLRLWLVHWIFWPNPLCLLTFCVLMRFLVYQRYLLSFVSSI